MILRTLMVGDLGTNCYLVACSETRAGLVIDPGGHAARILAAVRELAIDVQLIALTHFHFDHILATDEVRDATGAPLAIHRAEGDMLTHPPALFRMFAPGTPAGMVADRLLDDDEVLEVGALRIQVLATPGHSPGGVSFWVADEDVVFSGDALFREGVGRTDFPGSNSRVLVRSIRERLFALPAETVVYPGHGPSTTIAHERARNPWVGDNA